MESLIITLSHRVITLLSFRHPSSLFFEICRFVEQKKSTRASAKRSQLRQVHDLFNVGLDLVALARPTP